MATCRSLTLEKIISLFRLSKLTFEIKFSNVECNRQVKMKSMAKNDRFEGSLQ